MRAAHPRLSAVLTALAAALVVAGVAVVGALRPSVVVLAADAAFVVVLLLVAGRPRRA